MARIDFSKGGAKASPLMRRLAILVSAVLAIFFGLTMTYAMFWTYVRPYEASIKESRYGGGARP